MDILDRTLALRAQGLSYSAIADRLSKETNAKYTKDQVQKIVKRRGPQPERELRRVVIVGDIHANPDEELLDEIVQIDPDIIVVAGDLYDMKAFNPHEPHKPETFRKEIEATRHYLSTLSNCTSAQTIYLLTGNHDVWFERAVADALGSEITSYIMEYVDPAMISSAGIPKIEIVRTEVATHETITRHWMVLGDVFISHMNFTGKDAGQKLYSWVRDWSASLGLSEINVYVQAHCHALKMAYVPGGHGLIIESGMGGKPAIQGYAVIYNPKWRPGTVGAVYLEQCRVTGDEWLTELGSVRLLHP